MFFAAAATLCAVGGALAWQESRKRFGYSIWLMMQHSMDKAHPEALLHWSENSKAGREFRTARYDSVLMGATCLLLMLGAGALFVRAVG